MSQAPEHTSRSRKLLRWDRAGRLQAALSSALLCSKLRAARKGLVSNCLFLNPHDKKC